MKKIMKRLIVVFVLIAFNVNSYAAVSGNDSGGFMTKAEFDAFVENFNVEMNDFTNSIYSKIDSSIANYITGLGRDVIKADMIINNAQKSQVYKFLIWEDPGCATSGRLVTATGTISSQVDGQQRMEGYQFNASNNTGSEANNKARYFQNDFMGYQCYKGISYKYIHTSWVIQGVLVVTTSSSVTVKIGTSVSNCKFTRTAPNTNVATTTQQQYWSSKFSDSGWGTKYGYLTHNQAWKTIKANETKLYDLSSSPLSTTAAAFVREEYLNVDDGLLRNTTGYSLNTTGNSYIQVSGAGCKVNWIETLPFWQVKTENVAWSNLYNYSTVALGYPTKLYEGLAFFTAPDTGTATINIKVSGGSTDITFADLAISSTKFDNAYLSNNSTEDKMSTIEPAYNSSKSEAQQLKNVTMARVKCGDDVKITMEVKKGKTYYVKLTPRTSYNATSAPAAGKYAYVNKDLPDIYIEVNNEIKK